MRYLIHRKIEAFWLRLSRVVPASLAYWCAIRVWVFATSGQYSKTNVSKLPFSQAAQRFYLDVLAPRRAR